MITWSGSLRSCENTDPTTLSRSSTVNDAGTLNSRTILTFLAVGSGIAVRPA